MEIDASGAYAEDTDESNDAMGCACSGSIRPRSSAAQLDSNGQMGDAASSAGIHQSSYFAARLENMTVMDSFGDGIHARSGGAAQGADWNLSGNGGDGMEMLAPFIVERIDTWQWACGCSRSSLRVNPAQWAPRDVWIDWSRARLPSEQ